MNRWNRRNAFSLIELLVVLSIISILTMIAVPNFSDAKTKAKVAVVINNLRTTSIKFEMLNVDTNRYPLAGRWLWCLLWQIPSWLDDDDIRDRFRKAYDYMYGPYEDLFAKEIFTRYNMQDFRWLAKKENQEIANGFSFFQPQMMVDAIDYGCFWQGMEEENWDALRELAGGWVLYSPGPDLIAETPQFVETPLERYDGTDWNYVEKKLFMEYDVTNGTVSYGNIFRSQRNPGGLGFHPGLNE